MGRKKKEVGTKVNTELETNDVQTEVQMENAPDKEIQDLLSGYSEKIQIDEPSAIENEKQKKTRRKKVEPVQPQIIEYPLITGALMLMLIDLALPNLISLSNNFIVKKTKTGKKVKAGDLQMTKDQRAELEPIADQVAKEMMLKANPLAVLILSMLGIYGINFMMLKNE